MYYVIAKYMDFDGCVALKATHGKNLFDLKRRIEAQTCYTKIELITLSRPSAYPEYGLYRFVKTEAEFEKAAIQMYSCLK